MTLVDTNKKIDNLLALGQLFISEATELRESLAVKSQAPRKGLSSQQRAKLIARRLKTATKPV